METFELETAILAALPADMDHRISFSALMDGLRLKVGVVVSYLEISDLLDDLVTAGRVACWEFEDDGRKTYSLPQPAEPEPWELEIADWQSRALAAEAARDRLRRAVRAGAAKCREEMEPFPGAEDDMPDEGAISAARILGALTAHLTPADLAALEGE